MSDQINGTENTDATDIYNVYKESHIPVLIGFLAIYLFYIGASSIIKSTIPTVTDKQLHTVFDVFIAVLLVAYCVYSYMNLTPMQQTNILQNIWNWSADFYSSDNMILAATVFILVFYFIVFCFKISLHSSPYSLHLLESKAWIFLGTLVIVFLINHIFNTNIVYYLYLTDNNNSIWDTRFKNWGTNDDNNNNNDNNNVDYTDINNADINNTISNNISETTSAPVPQEQIAVETSASKPPKQVFNVANNIYTYNDAKLVCKSIGARLATYDEVEEAYKNGGEWCNYGWTDGQLALFPTQMTTWYSLQSDAKTKNSCGRPGVNGGFIMNPYQKYGVNCFGTKPAEKDSDIKPGSYITPSTNGTPSFEDVEERKRLQFWKTYGNQIMQLNSFNRTKWSE